MKERGDHPNVRLAVLKGLLQRFSFLVLILLSVALILFGAIEPHLVAALRGHVTDAFTPILDLFSRPAAVTARQIDRLQEALDVYRENQRLREENARLLQWRQAAQRLEAENRSLRSLLQFQPGPEATFISARVIAAPGTSFLRTVIVTAGQRQGVRKGQTAVAGPGLVGRVIEVGEWSARVLLITDINARIPVVLQHSRQRAILAGDNAEQPRLLYLPPETAVAVGDRVETSGHGGMFPPGLPIGAIASIGEGGIRVQPLVNLNRIEHLLLVDYGAAIEPDFGAKGIP